MGAAQVGTPPGDVSVAVDEASHVATVTIHRPPNNFFDTTLLRELGDTFVALDDDPACRAIVLAAEGKHFCAGRDFSRERGEGDDPSDVYVEAAKLLRVGVPWVAAVQGAAIGGGFGLAMAADFRVATPRARFSANFARLGYHHGFGLTVLLPRVVGEQRAAELLYTGDRVDGHEAARLGIVDELVDEDELATAAHAFAARLAASAPLAVRSIRRTLRGDLVDRFLAATALESAEQDRLRATEDFVEGTAAARERREPRFVGR